MIYHGRFKKIQSHTLYTYEINDDTYDLEKFGKNSKEIQSFLHYIQNYSESNKRRLKSPCKTVKERSRHVIPVLKLNKTVRLSDKNVAKILKNQLSDDEDNSKEVSTLFRKPSLS